MMRGHPAVLGGFSALFGLYSVLFFLFRLPGGGCHDLPCSGTPLSVNLLVVFSLGSPILGLVGAWELGKHRRAGSLAFIVAGLLPLVPALLLLQVPYYSLAILFLWWCPLLILAGVLGILNLPSKQPSPENTEERSEEDYMRSANCSPRRSAAARKTVLTATTRPALWRFRSSSDRCEMSTFS